MKVKTIFFAFSLLLSIVVFPQISWAQEIASGSSASFHPLLVTRGTDDRAKVLQAYLEQFNSPLAEHAKTFVEQADLYQLDWRFVAAIAGRESTFGKEEPCINAWGYGIFGNQMKCFDSYDEGIRVISKDLREKFMNQWGAQTIWQIGSMYAASPTWASGVIYFMNQIQDFADSQPATLPISL